MSATRRRSIAFTAPQMKWLETRSAELGMTVAKLVRRLVDDERSPNSKLLRELTIKTMTPLIFKQIVGNKND